MRAKARPAQPKHSGPLCLKSNDSIIVLIVLSTNVVNSVSFLNKLASHFVQVTKLLHLTTPPQIPYLAQYHSVLPGRTYEFIHHPPISFLWVKSLLSDVYFWIFIFSPFGALGYVNVMGFYTSTYCILKITSTLLLKHPFFNLTWLNIHPSLIIFIFH